LAAAALLTGRAIGLLLLLSPTSDRYADGVLQRLNSGIALYVVKELPLLEGGKVNEAALHELAHRTMTVNPSAEVYLLDPFGRVLSTAIPRNRIRRASVRLEPIQAFLRFPDSRPLYGDDPTSLAARRVFSVAAIQSGGRLQGYLYVVLGGQPAQSIDARLRGSYTLRTAAAALVLVLAGTLQIGGGLLLRRRAGSGPARMRWKQGRGGRPAGGGRLPCAPERCPAADGSARAADRRSVRARQAGIRHRHTEA